MDDCYAMYDEMQAEIRQLKETIRRLEDKIWEIEGKNDKKMTALTLEYEEKLHEKDCVISDLTNRLAQAQALLAHDGTNTGLPTSQTPPGKKKRIPNARTKTGKKKGGQPGREKHVLEGPEDDAVTDVVGHGSGEEDFLCPECNGENFVPTFLTKKPMYSSRNECSSMPESIYPHQLRRSRATNLYQNGVPIEIISRFLGHSSIETTKDHYAFPSMDQMRNAMNAGNEEKEEPLWEGHEDELAKLCGLR